MFIKFLIIIVFFKWYVVKGFYDCRGMLMWRGGTCLNIFCIFFFYVNVVNIEMNFYLYEGWVCCVCAWGGGVFYVYIFIVVYWVFVDFFFL